MFRFIQANNQVFLFLQSIKLPTDWQQTHFFLRPKFSSKKETAEEFDRV